MMHTEVEYSVHYGPGGEIHRSLIMVSQNRV